MQLIQGSTMPDFIVDTDRRNYVNLYSLINRPTVFWVIRYIGCPVCRYDVHILKENYKRIAEKGYNLYVVMQSDTEHIHRSLENVNLPFEIICDPAQQIYRNLDILPAANRAELAGDRSRLMEKAEKTKELGFTHGDYEGNEMQLPALFIVDTDGTVRYAHYGKSITDMPDIDELISLL